MANSSIRAEVFSSSKTVAAATTPERLVSSPSLVDSVILVPLAANTGDAFFGSTNTTAVLPVGVPITAPDGKKIDLYDIWVRVTVNGEGVAFLTVN